VSQLLLIAFLCCDLLQTFLKTQDLNYAVKKEDYLKYFRCVARCADQGSFITRHKVAPQQLCALT
jgi:hypothetical protein